MHSAIPIEADQRATRKRGCAVRFENSRETFERASIDEHACGLAGNVDWNLDQEAFSRRERSASSVSVTEGKQRSGAFIGSSVLGSWLALRAEVDRSQLFRWGFRLAAFEAERLDQTRTSTDATRSTSTIGPSERSNSIAGLKVATGAVSGALDWDSNSITIPPNGASVAAALGVCDGLESCVDALEVSTS